MTRRLLLVDDEPKFLLAFSEALGGYGIKVAYSESGEEGLDVLSRERFGVIISDYRMQGMDGIEFLRQASALSPCASRYLMTGTAGYLLKHDLQAKGLHMGDDGVALRVLEKPLSIDDITEAAQQGFERYERLMRQDGVKCQVMAAGDR